MIKMSEQKYLRDLEGFTIVDDYVSPMGGNYGVYVKDKQMALIHLDDDEVVMIIDREKFKITYKDEKIRIGEILFGLELDSIVDKLIEAYEEEFKVDK